MVHKCLNGRATDYLSQKFKRRLDHYDINTRYKKDLNLPRPGIEITAGQRTMSGQK